jgi:hypothetical protein
MQLKLFKTRNDSVRTSAMAFWGAVRLPCICRVQKVVVEEFFLGLASFNENALEKKQKKVARDAWIDEMHAAIRAQPDFAAPANVVCSTPA